MPFSTPKTYKSRGIASIILLLLVTIFGNVQAQDNLRRSTESDSSYAVSHQHNPRTAMLLSIVPGGGQIYNRQAWKLPIIYAGLGAMSYLVWDNYSQMKMFKDEYLYRVNHSGATQLEEYANYPTTNIYNLYQSKNKDFQLYLFIDIALYALNMVDAYVFAHLFDFEISDDLSLHIQPMPAATIGWGGGVKVTPAMNITLRFK